MANMQTNGAYTDPNITLAIGAPIPEPVSKNDRISLITTQRPTNVYEPIGSDRNAGVKTDDIPHKSTHWPLGRNLYANGGNIK